MSDVCPVRLEWNEGCQVHRFVHWLWQCDPNIQWVKRHRNEEEDESAAVRVRGCSGIHINLIAIVDF